MWWNLFLLFLITAGHTELQVTMVNRLHAGRISCGVLRHIRHIHDLMIPLFPLALIWFLGIRGPGLLVGGTWDDVSLVWRIVMGICWLGVWGLFYSTVRWWLYRVPVNQLSHQSRIVDIAERIGGLPVGDGPFRWLTKFPGNEIFQVDVVEKELRIPGLPMNWDGLSILHLTDLHMIGTTSKSFFEEVVKLAEEMPADIVVMTGDLLDKQALVEWLPSTLGKLNARLGCYFILGNHDWFLKPAEIRKAMTDLGWIDVSGCTVRIEADRVSVDSTTGQSGPALLIGGSERPWMGEHPSFETDEKSAFRLFLSHSPDNLPWAKKNGVDLMLSGHNHGGQVVLPVIGPVYSPSKYGVRYASGLFWEEPTLLFVSRGLSSRHPLRLGCHPELTKLILRPE